MNRRLILISALFTAVIGAVIGLATASMHHGRFASSLYQDLGRKYMGVGVITGLLVGAGQESIRQLKQQRDAEEAQAQTLNKKQV